MRSVHALSVILLTLALVVTGCGGDGPATPANGEGPGDQPVKGTIGEGPPTKDVVVAQLRSLLVALEANDYEKAVTFLIKFPGMSDEAAVKAVAGFIDRREISGPGIDILAEKGRFGPLKEVFAERGEAWAKKAGVDVEKCYALAHEGAEVAVFQDGSALRLIRLDDVGKL